MAAVSSRYARAFADVVFDAKLDPATTVAQLRSFVQLFEQNADLRRVWESPAVAADQKRKLLDSIAAQMGSVQKPVRNFLAVLIDHSRIMMLPEIARQFETELNSRLGFVEAEIVSSRALGEAEKQSLVAKIATTTGRKVSPTYKIDATLLGGATVRVGSTVYDGSVRGQLQRIRHELVSE